METFMNFIEGRKRQVDAIQSVLTKLHYERGVSPEEVAKMDADKLADLVSDIRPTENWSMPRFIGMIKHIANLTIEWRQKWEKNK